MTTTSPLTEPVAAHLWELPVVEVFDRRTFQGEGPSAGTLATFVRFGDCNLRCTWCDTPETWVYTEGRAKQHRGGKVYDRDTEITWRPVDDVLRELLALETPLVVITGGEPLLHQRRPGFGKLLHGLTAADRRIEVETNGTTRPAADPGGPVPHYNVSPKLSHSGDSPRRRIVPAALADFAELARWGQADFKFVAGSLADLAEIDALVTDHQLPRARVWVMPEGITADTVLATARLLAEPAAERGFNLTLRTHVLLWGNERGR